ncbi:MAG: hypothetical protein ON057_001164 [Glomeribacter sp. 1016415]|nr:hypothetical protein [Glomeribacter sp. 1016415]
MVRNKSNADLQNEYFAQEVARGVAHRGYVTILQMAFAKANVLSNRFFVIQMQAPQYEISEFSYQN